MRSNVLRTDVSSDRWVTPCRPVLIRYSPLQCKQCPGGELSQNSAAHVGMTAAIVPALLITRGLLKKCLAFTSIAWLASKGDDKSFTGRRFFLLQ
ncbi:unnamed protein product [Heligmosomoides polygyrus]|uniref:Uncharacterized protein n=1 Tax=Heligmosomoides polygyrus TaxID=6339 RepID=A0A183GCJ1_HELPZ|nr:unnamed protein product [Heligmosomoides polygyrus]